MYEINKNTYAIIPLGKGKTEIVEQEENKIINKNALEIIKESCEYYGNNFEGLIKGSQSCLGAKYKLPINIETTQDLIVFPTNAPTNKDCCWLVLKNIKTYNKTGEKTQITFKNNKTKTIPISTTSFENQMFRASRLLLIIHQRIKKQ